MGSPAHQPGGDACVESPGVPLSSDIATAEALVQSTRRRVAEALALSGGGLGVSELAERIDLHPNAVRRHLSILAEAGIVAVERDRPSGRGRPRLRYRLVDAHAPRVAAHQELVRILTAYLVRTGAGMDDVEEFGRRQGGFFATEEGATGILDAFTRLGFAPRETGSARDAGRGRLGMRLDHCPFRDAVSEPGGEIICRLHRGLAQGIASAAAPGSTVTGFEPRDPVRAGCRVQIDDVPSRDGGR